MRVHNDVHTIQPNYYGNVKAADSSTQSATEFQFINILYVRCSIYSLAVVVREISVDCQLTRTLLV